MRFKWILWSTASSTDKNCEFRELFKLKSVLILFKLKINNAFKMKFWDVVNIKPIWITNWKNNFSLWKEWEGLKNWQAQGQVPVKSKEKGGKGVAYKILVTAQRSDSTFS